jgi:hypothetical protein
VWYVCNKLLLCVKKVSDGFFTLYCILYYFYLFASLDTSAFADPTCNLPSFILVHSEATVCNRSSSIGGTAAVQ